MTWQHLQVISGSVLLSFFLTTFEPCNNIRLNCAQNQSFTTLDMLLIMQTRYMNVLYPILKNKDIYMGFILFLIFISLQIFIVGIALYPSIFCKNIAWRYMYLYITASSMTGYNNSLIKLLKFFWKFNKVIVTPCIITVKADCNRVINIEKKNLLFI